MDPNNLTFFDFAVLQGFWTPFPGVFFAVIGILLAAKILKLLSVAICIQNALLIYYITDNIVSR